MDPRISLENRKKEGNKKQRKKKRNKQLKVCSRNNNISNCKEICSVVETIPFLQERGRGSVEDNKSIIKQLHFRFTK
jgi:hypothetical protein